jgi:glutamate dehydrogenase
MSVSVEQLKRALKPKDTLLQSFGNLLFAKTDADFLEQFDVDSLIAISQHGLKFIQHRQGDEILLRVYNPSFQADGWEAPFTVIELCLVDRPFIVDSLKAELKRQGCELVHLLHPILGIERNESGKLTHISKDASLREAYELFFIQVLPQERLEPLQRALYDVLYDVVLATRDYTNLKQKALEVSDYLNHLPPSHSRQQEELSEAATFLKWLADDNYVFLGYREYDLIDYQGVPSLQINQGSGLGIFVKTNNSAYTKPVPISQIPDGLRERVTGGRILIVTKTNSESTVHRPARMDYIGIKKINESGEIAGEKRFVGLFTSKGLSTPVADIPILRLKLRRVLELDSAMPGSHDYKQITSIFNSIPREELFWLDATELHQDIRTIMSLEKERGVRLTIRPDPLGRGLAAMVIMPRDHFNAEVRKHIQDYLEEKLAATHTDYQLAMGEDESQLRFHFFFTTEKSYLDVDPLPLEADILELTRTWDDQVEERLVNLKGDAGRKLSKTYLPILEEGYKADISVNSALYDIQVFSELKDKPLVRIVNVLDQRVDDTVTQLKIYHPGRSLILSDVMPLMENIGFKVLEQSSYSFELDKEVKGLDIFRIQDKKGQNLNIREDGVRLETALLSLLSNEAENDRLNQLVLAGLTLRQVALLRAYQTYYAQLNAVTSPNFVTNTLLKHPHIAVLLFKSFDDKFQPPGDLEAFEKTKQEILEALDKVSSLPEDTVLRGLLNLIEATVRTNFYLNKEVISFKLESRRVSSMPEPRPLYEIGVSGLGVDGTHLRGGKVARGGIRWSDRPDDFRTEVLGLMKTQMTKNAVIVPVGSKGGFVLKRAPSDREALRSYVKTQYKAFIRGLLDLTDNLVDGHIVHPKDLVIYDEGDPYLVVAADKGTATFSDLANETAAEYTFWLGDAFASGGSYGYDHKKEGITARGAWECVSRHFREMGINVKEQSFTVAGIGDMSGDVFGNGMLYTPTLKLVAAFNHQHIFIDPNPNPNKSFNERKRLFELPRSSWADYNHNLISEGGGVFERAAKSIPLSPQMQILLDTTATALSGQELIRAVLKMPVDLLWNGGIGTYVKSSSESNADVGDSSNDVVRISSHELKAKVVGEGGNLGFTQLARIEYARAGGRINTDAIDNSAGVDLSDHEVNIKILVQPLVNNGELSFVQRNKLLKEMTPEVNALVLHDNYTQSLCLSLAQKRSQNDITIFASLIEYLSEEGGLNTAVEYLPTQRQILERQKTSEGLTRSELAILLAYTKMGIYRHLLESNLPDEAHFQHYLFDYFPQVLEECYPEAIKYHALRKEIIATQFTNKVVDLLGITFVHRMIRDTGAVPGDIIRAALIAYELIDVSNIQKLIFALDNKVSTDTQCASLHELVKAIEGIATWILSQNLSIENLIQHYREPLGNIRQHLDQFLSEIELQRYQSRCQHFESEHLPQTLAKEIAGFAYLPASLGMIHSSQKMQQPLDYTARTFFDLGERLSLGQLRDTLSVLPSNSKWDKIAINNLILELYDIQSKLTEQTLSTSIEQVLQPKYLKRYDQALEDIKQSDAWGLSSGQALARLLKNMLDGQTTS